MIFEINEQNGGYTATVSGRLDTGKVIIEHINDEIKKVFMMTGFFNLFDIR